MLKVFGGEGVSLSQVIEINSGIQWDDGWLAVSGEGVCIIVHEGEIVVADSVSGGKSCTHSFKLIGKPCRVCNS